MSAALDYLVQARPEAMTHYFSFLKDAGKQLDPKTRNLISVITKVHAQTERGLKQYLKRALREGCSAAEVIDALLMAFPALGLTKIVWATDVILSMNLPEFTLESLRAGMAGTGSTQTTQTTQAPPADRAEPGPRWRDVLPLEEVPDGEVRRVECEGRGLFVHRQGHAVKVYDSLCPHKATNIPELALNQADKNGITLTCPQHGWQFDVHSGDCIKNGDTPLTRVESQVHAGLIQARW
ncbi:Rieske 2Fe-2S domain-containing protein [Hylemonella gracilis]|uniref:Carboxymuconolactone decarboxylase n=1 Tax=Hylemonella gracilis ATCC 19624 TaxID=887062 RepID=F3KRR6_9BURK|nr:Rieske 2Fe-2S domain-containing protein [Hylemonella gracilis]EGI77517.1 carboxymuconolactone decarboxylase [Hylemonella gracilis ATCC 19624]